MSIPTRGGATRRDAERARRKAGRRRRTASAGRWPPKNQIHSLRILRAASYRARAAGSPGSGPFAAMGAPERSYARNSPSHAAKEPHNRGLVGRTPCATAGALFPTSRRFSAGRVERRASPFTKARRPRARARRGDRHERCSHSKRLPCARIVPLPANVVEHPVHPHTLWLRGVRGIGLVDDECEALRRRRRTPESVTVHVSHERSDAHAAKRLYDALPRERFDCWLDTALLEPGDQWNSEIENKIVSSDYFLVLHSSTTTLRAWRQPYGGTSRSRSGGNDEDALSGSASVRR